MRESFHAATEEINARLSYFGIGMGVQMLSFLSKRSVRVMHMQSVVCLKSEENPYNP